VVAAGEEQDDLVLGLVGVLVLVDEDVLEALAVVLQHVGVVAQQPHVFISRSSKSIAPALCRRAWYSA
jgi:hypothetical protein